MNDAARWRGPLELFLLMLALGAIFVSVPLHLGRLGLSWDTLNHHIYLGWQAHAPRFEFDFMAASLQSYQYPYLYWPLYAMAVSGFSGQSAGVVLALLHLVLVPPVWTIANALIPGADWRQTIFRVSAVLMSFMSILVLKSFEVPGNDLLAAAPLLFAIAIASKFYVQITAGSPVWSDLKVHRSVCHAGLWAGVSVAFKLSNGYAAVFLPLLFLIVPNVGAFMARVRLVIWCSASVLVGFFAAYGYWGFLLYKEFGSPLFPFL